MTKNDLIPLEMLRGKRIRNLETELSMLASLNAGERDVQFEVPLKLTFDQNELFIYNKWRIESESRIGIDKLVGGMVEHILFESNILTFVLDDTSEIRVDLADEGYSGPEAMVLYGPGDSVVVWG